MGTISCKLKTRPSSELFVVPQKNCHPPSSRSCETSATLGPRAIRARGQGRHAAARSRDLRDVLPVLARQNRRRRKGIRRQVQRATESRLFENTQACAVGQSERRQDCQKKSDEEIANLKKQSGKDMLISGRISIEAPCRCSTGSARNTRRSGKKRRRPSASSFLSTRVWPALLMLPVARIRRRRTKPHAPC